MRKKLKRISPAGYVGCYYLLTEWRDSDEAGFDLLVSDGRQAWQCQVHRDSLHQMACEVDRDLHGYCAETRHALSLPSNDDSDDFDFEVKSSGPRLQLTWKKNIPGDDVKFKLGSLQLVACPNSGEVVCRMLDFSVENVADLQTSITDLEVENSKLKQQTDAVLQRLEVCVAEKDTLEQDLFGKFKVLINSKKSRIRQLKLQADQAREEASQAAAQVSRTASLASATSTAEDDDNQVDGGAELSRRDSLERQTRRATSSQSLTHKPSIIASSQLLEDDDQSLAVQPLAKRRRRKESGAVGRQPEIPLPPSMSTQPPRPSSSLRRKQVPETQEPSMDTGGQIDDFLDDM